MARKRFSVEQIIAVLGEAEVLVSQEQTIGIVCKLMISIGISWEPTLRLAWPHSNLNQRSTASFVPVKATIAAC